MESIRISQKQTRDNVNTTAPGTTKEKSIRRFEIWLADMPTMGSGSHIQQGRRPVVVVSNNMANTYSPIVTVVPLTTKSRQKKRLPTHTVIYGFGLFGRNLALCEQVTSIDKSRLILLMGYIDNDRVQKRIDKAITVQLSNYHKKKQKSSVPSGEKE